MHLFRVDLFMCALDISQQNHQSLFLTCGSYVCDRTLDEKPYCDRSCNAPNYQGHRRKKRGVRTESMSPGERKVNSGEFYVVVS